MVCPPAAHDGARFLDDQRVDLDDQAGVLRHADELPWFQQPAPWMLPAGQGLETHESAVWQGDDRLQVRKNLTLAHAAA